MQVDDVAYDTASVVISKGKLYGGRHLLAPGMSPTRPGFTVALFDRAGPLAALRYGLALPLGLLSRMPGVRLLAARRVTIENAAVPVQTDGDIGGYAPLSVTDARRPIQVVVG